MTSLLVVDDDPDIRRLLQRLLELEGYQVTTAAGGAEALELLRVSTPEAIILDIQMPDLDGWVILGAIRGRGIDTKVVLCSVKSSPEDLLRGWELGCDGFVTKPFDPTELTAEVRSVIARSGPEREASRAAGLTAARTALARLTD